jgi:hypothetical protein
MPTAAEPLFIDEDSMSSIDYEAYSTTTIRLATSDPTTRTVEEYDQHDHTTDPSPGLMFTVEGAERAEESIKVCMSLFYLEPEMFEYWSLESCTSTRSVRGSQISKDIL